LVIISIVVGLFFGGVFGSNAVTDTQKKDATDSVATGGTASNPPPSLTGADAFKLGDMGMGPWGGASKFIDSAAQWIWNLKSAVADAPNDPIKFSNVYNNTTGSNMEATLHVIVDNEGTVFLNSTEVKKVAGGWDTETYPRVDLTLKPGYNVIDIVAKNSGGSAGLVMALTKKSDNSILLRSDSSWKTNAV